MDAIRASHNVIYPPAANHRRAIAVRTLAQEVNASFTGVVLGYLQSQPFTTVPIIGARNLPHLRDSLAGDGVWLEDEQRELIDAL
jgi:aryl-alcohol dehydrogenase-like predicted oxidoreductase